MRRRSWDHAVIVFSRALRGLFRPSLRSDVHFGARAVHRRLTRRLLVTSMCTLSPADLACATRRLRRARYPSTKHIRRAGVARAKTSIPVHDDRSLLHPNHSPSSIRNSGVLANADELGHFSERRRDVQVRSESLTYQSRDACALSPNLLFAFASALILLTSCWR